MSDVETSEYCVNVYTFAVPNPATRRQMDDLVYFADQKWKELNPGEELADDSWMVEGDEEHLMVRLTVR